MHVNIKRLLSFLVVLAMVLSMTPVTGIPAIEAKADETESETVKTTVTDNLVFLEGTQTAYCPVCKEDAEWVAYTGQHADTVQNIAGETPRFHYYLTEDLEYTTYALQSYEHICFHLNGHDVKPAADATAAARPFSCTQNFDLMGTGTVYGGTTPTADTGSIIGVNGGKASGCFEMHSGTLANSEGVTHPLLTIGANGGRIFIYGGTVNGNGETIYTYGTNETNTNENRGFAQVKIAGGTVNGDLNIGYKTKDAKYAGGSSLTLSGGTVNGAVNMLQGSPATISGAAKATSISVAADAKLTVKEGWSGSATVDFAASPAASSVVEGAFTGTLTHSSGSALVSSNGGLKVDATFDATAETNYCEHCDAYVPWTPLYDGDDLSGLTAQPYHYYLAENMTSARLLPDLGSSVGSAFVLCLNLNGKTLTNNNYLYCGRGWTINVMGDGKIINAHASSPLFYVWSCTVNLYGGTFTNADGCTGNVVKMEGGSGTTAVRLYNDAKVEGTVAAAKGELYLNGAASVTDLRLSGTGLMTVAANWNGEAVLTVADGLFAEDGKTVLAANAVASGDFPGSMTDALGVPYVNVDGALVYSPKTPVWGEFDPKACGGYAYCEACGEEAGPVEWIEVCTDNDALGFKDNSDGTLSPFHYYLSKDISHDGTGGQWIGLYKVGGCINLNGHTLTTASRVFAGGAGAYMNIIAGDGGAINYTGEAHQGGIVTGVPTNLYGGTYTSTQATDAEVYKPIIQVTGGTTNLYDVTANGRMELASGTTTFYGTTSCGNVTIDTYFADANGTTGTAKGKLVIDKDWTGNATLTVRDGIFTNGVVAAANGAATGDFTGTLTCNGTQLYNQDGTLMVDTTFNPEAATNYCSACKAFVAWEALPETVPTIGTDGACLHYYVPADMTATGEKTAFLFVTDSNGADVANVPPKVCLYLNNKTLTLTQYLYGGFSGVVNVIGDGTLTTTNSTLITPYTSTVNLYGGTYIAKTGGKALTMGTSGSKVNLYGDAELQGEAAVSQGALTLHDESGANKVVVSGSGKVTLDAAWTGTMVLNASAVMDGDKVPAANVVVNGDALNGTVTTPDGTAFVYADGQLGIDTSFDAETGTGYCRACGTTVKWEALGETWDTVYPTGTHYHYYLADDITNTAVNLFYTATNVGKPEGYTGSAVGNTFCLYLNGKTLTLNSGKIYAGNSGFVNVMGEGTVTSTGAYVFYPYTGTVNLYGGTYIASATGMVGFTGGGGTVYNIYEDADLQGTITVSQGKLNVYDEAKLSTVEITGGLTTFKSGWTGTAGVSAAADLLTDNTIDVTKAYVEDGATGTLSSVTGVAASVVDHAIVLDNPDPDVFAPEDYNGYAFCPDCGQLVQWIDFNAYVAKNGFHDADNTLSDTSGVITLHFYLTADLEYTTNVMSTNENVIFNLNGYDITAVAADGAEEITASYAFSSTQGLVLLNTSETMSTVTGWQTAAGNATVIHMGGGGATSWARLYDNITLTTHEDCTTDAPIVNIASNGGKLYMKGGVIDASKKVNNLYPTAVYVQGQPNQEKYGESIGEFYLEGGEIKGGSSVSGGGAVQIGSRSNDETYLDGTKFVMTGGTISGGNATYGGNLLINQNAAEVSITGGTITGGTAKHGGNIRASYCDVTIGGTAVISNGCAEAPDTSFGGGGNIYFGQGTLKVEGGTISGGKVYTKAGSGGNIYLDKQAPDGAAAGTEVAPTHFIMTDGSITGGYVKDSQHDQNYGGNIRAYNISTVSVTGGSITGGTGCSEQRANSANMYISYSDAHVTNGWPANVTFGGDANIDGNVHIKGEANLVLTGAPVIAGGTYGLSYNNEKVLPNISGLTAGAQIELSEMTVNVPLTAACDNFEDVKGYITVIDSGATLTGKDNQLILVGVALVNGEEITWYADNAAAVAAYTAEDYAVGKYIQLGLDTALALTGGEYLIDLAGNVAGEVAITGTGIVHLFDSANLDFEGFRTATVADTVTLAERDHTVFVDEEAVRFIIVTDADGKTSAHLLSMAVNGVNLNADKAGLSYNAEYKCDAYLAEMISAYGMILSLKDMPGTGMNSSDKCTVLTNFTPDEKHTVTSTSSSVTGIFKDTRTAEKNAEYGKMKIYANAYIELDLDGDGAADILVADNENVGKQAGNAWSLYDVLFEIDQNWADYADDQEAAKAFFDQWFDLGTSLYADDFTNIDVKIDVEGGEGEGVTPEDTDVSVPVED